MAAPLIINTLNAGELSPSLYGRTDFGKYKAGMSLCRNFFVDPRGGILNRSGTRFVGNCYSSATANRLIPFSFSTTQTYVLVFGNYALSFVTNGGYVLNTATNITSITQANPGVISDIGHGYANGTMIYVSGVAGMTQLNGRFFTVANATTNTYTLVDFYGVAVNTTSYGAYSSGGTAASIYTIASPYAAADLQLVKYTQNSDVMTLCHPNYAPQYLSRYGNTNWTLKPIVFGPIVQSPAGCAAIDNMSGSTTYEYVVTAIIGNSQSRQSNVATVTSATLSSTSGAQITVTWNPVSGADQYYVYRTPEIAGTAPPNGSLFGFIGTTTGNSFIDNNIQPNFSICPPNATNPFGIGNYISSVSVVNGGSGYGAITAAITDSTGSGATVTPVVVGGVIQSVTVNTPGSNYSSNPSIVLMGATSGGTGASAKAVVNSSYQIASISVINGGSGYINPSITIVADFGSGATATATVSGGVITSITVTNGGSGYYAPPGEGKEIVVVTITDSGSTGTSAVLTVNVAPTANNPNCACYFQERQVFGGTTVSPDQLNFSKSGDFNNFDVSEISQDDDAIQVTIATQQLNAIKSMVPFTSMLVFTSGTCFKVDSGVSGGPLTPSSLSALPQSFNGASDVPPIVIGYEILYVQNKQSSVRDLTYNFYANLYTGTDISILSNHLFFGHEILQWAWAQEPNKTLWAIREDGIMLSLTYVKEQEIYAWARHDTINGQFTSVCTVSENNEDAIYVIANRLVNGQYLQYVERMQSRIIGGDVPIGIPGNLDLCWFVDAGLQTALVYPAATLTPASTTAQPSITSIDVINGGTGYTSPTVVINDPTGTGATLVPVVSGGVITAININSYGTNYTSPVISIYDSTGTGAVAQAATQNLVTMTLSSAVLSSANVGNAIRINQGFGTLYSVSGTTIQVNVMTPLANIFPAVSGSWSCTPFVSTVTGLDHLDGCTVSILADGNVMPQQTVINGSITIPVAASLITAGLPITAQAQTMYLDTGENPTMQTKRIQVNAVTARVYDTRGLFMGHNLNDLYEIKERTETIPMGRPIPLITGDERLTLDPALNEPAQIAFQQTYPLPAHVQSLIIELSEGDTMR